MTMMMRLLDQMRIVLVLNMTRMMTMIFVPLSKVVIVVLICNSKIIHSHKIIVF